jgi:monofunctional glycosyltransferase
VSTFLRILAALAGLFVVWLLAVWPPPVWYRSHWPAETAFMAMRRAAGAGVSHGSAVRPLRYEPVPLDSISPFMQDAAIIGEDGRFWTHGGIDYVELRKALGYREDEFDWGSARDRHEVVALLPRLWTRRSAVRGASTMTQQLAKNLYFSASRNPLRKVKEAITAYRLEGAMRKQRILELYLNLVELGDGIWGVEAASEAYFGRPASQLTRDQAAALAGALPFPLRSNPVLKPGRMQWRQQLILRRMRGESVEVPRVEEEPADLPPLDTVVTTESAPPFDSTAILDSAGLDSTAILDSTQANPSFPPDSPPPATSDSALDQ